MSHVLIVDDEEAICWGLSRLLKQGGHTVATAASAEDAFAAVSANRPDIAVLDVRLPGQDGLSAMGRLLELAGEIPVIVITAFGSLDTAVSAFKNGAFDYLPKPFDLDQATAVIDRALQQARAARQTSKLPGGLALPNELLGTSPAMQEVFKRIALVAPTDSAVLITGETGTGKELVARAIHRYSGREERPLVPINLAALSPSLVESELFGHVRGAFTGAEQSRQGLLELADGGTVLLDEAGDIPLAVQVKLLRVLEQQEVTRVGSVQARHTSFRVLAATNRDLRQECDAGRFREDLYFRLAVVEIRIPPLRERPEDIPLLAERFLAKITRTSQSTAYFSPQTIRELQHRPWLGNVRELHNAVEHATLMARGGPIAVEHLPPPLTLRSAGSHTPIEKLCAAVRNWTYAQFASGEENQNMYGRFLAEVEPTLFEVVLERTKRNRADAAGILGVHRATLRKKLHSSKGTRSVSNR